METQVQALHKDLKDFINLRHTLQKGISENEMHYCWNFLPVNKTKCRTHKLGGKGNIAQNSLREQIESQRTRKDTGIHKVISSHPLS